MADSIASLLSELPKDPLFSALLPTDAGPSRLSWMQDRTVVQNYSQRQEHNSRYDENERQRQQIQSADELGRKHSFDYFYYVQVALPQLSKNVMQRKAATRARIGRKSGNHQTTISPFTKEPIELISTFEQEARKVQHNKIDSAPKTSTFIGDGVQVASTSQLNGIGEGGPQTEMKLVNSQQTVLEDSKGNQTNDQSEQSEILGEKRKFKLPTKRGVVVDLPPKPVQPEVQPLQGKGRGSDLSKNKGHDKKGDHKRPEPSGRSRILRSHSKMQGGSNDFGTQFGRASHIDSAPESQLHAEREAEDHSNDSNQEKRVKMHTVAFVRDDEAPEVVSKESSNAQSSSNALEKEVDKTGQTNIPTDDFVEDHYRTHVNDPQSVNYPLESTEPGELELDGDDIGFEGSPHEIIQATDEQTVVAEKKGEGDNNQVVHSAKDALLSEATNGANEIAIEKVDENLASPNLSHNVENVEKEVEEAKTGHGHDDGNEPSEYSPVITEDSPSNQVEGSSESPVSESDRIDSPNEFIADPDFLDDEELLAIARELSFDNYSSERASTTEIALADPILDSELSVQSGGTAEASSPTLNSIEGHDSSEVEPSLQGEPEPRIAFDDISESQKEPFTQDVTVTVQNEVKKANTKERPKRGATKKVAEIVESITPKGIEDNTEQQTPANVIDIKEGEVSNVPIEADKEQEIPSPVRRRSKRNAPNKSQSELEEEQAAELLTKGLVLDHGPDWSSIDDSSQRVVGGRSTVRLLRAMERRSSMSKAKNDALSGAEANNDSQRQRDLSEHEPDVNQDDLASEIAGELALRSAKRQRRQKTRSSADEKESTIVEEGELQLEADQIEF